MKIHIFGASGSGVTTLGKALAKKSSYPYFDNDSYFWEPSDVSFTFKRDPAERNAMLLNDIAKTTDCIVGGSMVSWGDEWLVMFDAVVFLLLPPDIRLERLKKREFERYGDIIFTDPERKKQHEAFLTWASGYDDNTTQNSTGKGLGRTIQVHRDWMKKLNCPLLQITGSHTVEERVELVLNFISANQ